jgi:hypothetical protein
MRAVVYVVRVSTIVMLLPEAGRPLMICAPARKLSEYSKGPWLS